MKMFQSLEGKLLLAMPAMRDPRFVKSVIYLCSHSPEGAMGIAINHHIDNLDFPQLLKQLQIPTKTTRKIPIHAGGPVEPGRGFVLHSADYAQTSTMKVSPTIHLSATVDILKSLAEGRGPGHYLLALGYAGWGEGQLERELTHNSWLTVDADEAVIFETPREEKWSRAMACVGVDVAMLSGDAGHA